MRAIYILGIYGVICLLFAAIFSSDVSKPESVTLKGNGGIFGPLKVTEKNSVYEITISNYVALGKWSHIEVEVLNDKKEYLFSFGDEMWHESGRDSDGYWEESKTNYSIDITFKKPGEYYLNIGAERNDGEGKPISVSAVKERGSNLAFLILGVIALGATVTGVYFRKSLPSDAPGKRNGAILAIVLILLFILALFYSARGWGYMGYHGYHHGPSFFYLGGPNVYHQPSNRDGSVSGAGHRGGGLSGGK